MSNDSRRRRVGHIGQLQNGKWLAQVTAGVRVDGRKRRVSRTFDSETEAEAWIVAQTAEMGRRPEIGSGVTVRMVWVAYKESRLQELARKTQALYVWCMESVWLDVVGDINVGDVTPALVQRHIAQMPRAKAQHAKSVMSAVLSWAARNGLLSENPLMGHRFDYPEQERCDYDDDPFAIIEGVREVWSADEVLACFRMIRGLPLEPAWLACVGAGLRVEEALALRGKDVRRVMVGGRAMTQVAVHAARTDLDERKATKTRQSVRIVSLMEPMGERYWELASVIGRDELVCPVSAANQNKRWRGYFAEPSTSKHAPRKDGCNNRGRLHDLRYVPLSKMRNTHVTLMQQAGVPDSLNALMHGHTEQVERRYYMRPDVAEASMMASDRLRLVV